MSEETKSEAKIIDPTVAQDVDGDGVLDLDPLKAQITITDLVILDHELRDHGSSVADLLRNVAHTARGIRV